MRETIMWTIVTRVTINDELKMDNSEENTAKEFIKTSACTEPVPSVPSIAVV